MFRAVGPMKPIHDIKKYDYFMKMGRDIVNHLGTHLDVTIESVHFLHRHPSDEPAKITFDDNFQPILLGDIDPDESRWCYLASDGTMFEIPVSNIAGTAVPMIKHAMQTAEGQKNLTESFYIKQRKAKEARDAKL